MQTVPLHPSLQVLEGRIRLGMFQLVEMELQWVLTPREVRKARQRLNSAFPLWTFIVEHSETLGSKTPVGIQLLQFSVSSRNVRVNNHLCWLSGDLLNCDTRGERTEAGVKKMQDNCASTTADGGRS